MYQFKESEYDAMMIYITQLKRMLWQHHVKWDDKLRDADEVFWECIDDIESRKRRTNRRTREYMQDKRISGDPKYLRGKAKERYLMEQELNNQCRH